MEPGAKVSASSEEESKLAQRASLVRPRPVSSGRGRTNSGSNVITGLPALTEVEDQSRLDLTVL